MKKHIPTTESGRSMVEMLGVLAIMGVLSIGAVAGYRWAMDKRNANEILNEVRKRAITSSQARISGHEIDLTEYGDNGRINGKYGVVADNAYNGDDRFFTLTVSDIPQGVCDKVIDINWQMPAAILLDGVAVDDNTVCGEGNNEMLFAFANDLKSGAVAGETTDPNEEHCWGHGTWDGTSCFCEPGWSGDDCSMTQFCNKNGTCYDCDKQVSDLVDAAECSKCDDSRSPRFVITDGLCVRCSDSSGYKATAAECAKCDGSSTPRVLLENGYCALADCGVNQFQDTNGYCWSCSDSYGRAATEAECAKCDDSSTPRVLLENGYCALADCGVNQFQDTNGYCWSCSDSYGRAATEAECAKCDDSSTPREMRNGYCIRPGYCPEGFLGTNGYCYSCSYSGGASATKAECAKCDTSSTPREMRNGYCIRPGYCPEGFLDSYGHCRSCSDSYGQQATEAECAKCDGSSTPRVLLENGYCALADCGVNQFQDTNGYCWSCSDSYGQQATEAECDKCEGSSIPRYMDGSYCYRCPMSLSSGSLNTQEKCETCRGTWDAGTKKCS